MSEELTLIEQAARIVKGRLDKLLTLGTADAIALELQALNVKAVCGSASRCAIAVDLMNTLTAEFGPDHSMALSVPANSSVKVYSMLPHCEATSVRYGGEANIIEDFIMRFDKAQYPELISGLDLS